MSTRHIKQGKFAKIRKFETPEELPEKYRNLLKKMLFVQADTEFASVQQHLEWQQNSPSPEDKWVLSRIVADEVRHGLTMTRLLKQFGKEGEQMVQKLLARKIGEHTLDSFNIEFENWESVLAFTCFVDRVGLYQLEAFGECSYAPLAREMPLMLNEEKLHIGFGYNGLKKVISDDGYLGDMDSAQKAVNFWLPRALDMFGHSKSENADLAVELGIKKWNNIEMRDRYYQEATQLCESLDLQTPDIDEGRRIL